MIATCKQCGIEFKHSPSGRGLFCSKACYLQTRRSATMATVTHPPTFLGGI